MRHDKGFIREHKLIRRAALVGGIVVGLYYLGKLLGWF